MKIISENVSFDGVQGVYSHTSKITGTDMTFAVYVPPHGRACTLPVVWYLSGLTCSTRQCDGEGREYRRAASELGLIIICPDTSPRGDDVADEAGNWQMGKGAGFYLDATEAPGRSTIRCIRTSRKKSADGDCRQLSAPTWAVRASSAFMGGHGALTIALKNPERTQELLGLRPHRQSDGSRLVRSGL